jgi:hypothetical protein
VVEEPGDGSSSEQEAAALEQVELEPDLPPGQEPEEGAPAKRFVKRSALEQDAIIPAGWKPTARKPIPVVRCRYIFKDNHPRGGERCGRWSLRGSELCWTHGGKGNLRNVEEYRRAIIDAARLQLTEAVPDALNTLITLAESSPADNVRLKAATEILDRTGLKSPDEVHVDVEVTHTTPAATLAERLDKLKKAAGLQADMQRRVQDEEDRIAESAAGTAVLELLPATTATTDPDDGVIEGEIVDD